MGGVQELMLPNHSIASHPLRMAAVCVSPYCIYAPCIYVEIWENIVVTPARCVWHEAVNPPGTHSYFAALFKSKCLLSAAYSDVLSPLPTVYYSGRTAPCDIHLLKKIQLQGVRANLLHKTAQTLAVAHNGSWSALHLVFTLHRTTQMEMVVLCSDHVTDFSSTLWFIGNLLIEVRWEISVYLPTIYLSNDHHEPEV